VKTLLVHLVEDLVLAPLFDQPVVPERFAALAPLLPAGWPAVAESGVAGGLDARRMQQLGYRLALIGTAG